MLDLKTPEIDNKNLKRNARIVGLTTIGAFIALIIFGHFFPVQVSIENYVTNVEQESKTNIGFDPLALTALKIWNNTNQETQSIELDSCNVGKRIDSVTWQITLKDC
ncbi:hypothetical protein LCGC14_2464440 [marine sediment metagenome]|uniref:Uncharacterized protein n=1 Tax=marine sediment metagenome TaxID=412755 RepID=A0A0F9E650_9ZZZZ